MNNELIGKIVDGKYRTESLIRETELGDFYRGINLATGVPVTIKILAPAMAIDARYVDRFLADASAQSAISDPALLNILTVGSEASGIPYAVYEECPEETLADVMSRDGAFDAPRAVGLATQIASALTAAHAAGFIHAGLNPNKIFMRDAGAGETVKVYDFGRRLHSKNSMNSVGYLSPEQTTDVSAADERSDVYSLGVVIFEMLTGRRPFEGATPAEVIEKQAFGGPPALSTLVDDLHPQIEPIVLSAMAHEADRRYQKMSDLEEDLRRVGTEIGANVPVQSMASAAGAGAGKRPLWQTTSIILVGVVLLAGALIYATSVRQTNPTASLAPDANSLPVQPINPATGAQEDALTKLGDMGDASLVPTGTTEFPLDTMPGGDGYNAWANGGVPPAGAPLPGSSLQPTTMTGPQPPQYIPPTGQTYTVPSSGGSQFMPTEGGVILVPIPANAEPAANPTPTPKTPATNTAVKPLMTPTPKPAAPAKSGDTASAAPATKANPKGGKKPEEELQQ